METLENIEGYFKARCSYLICTYSAVQPIALSKGEYEAMSAKFETAMQQEINYLLNSCEENREIDLIHLLNRLLQISDKARLQFIEINNPGKMHVPKSVVSRNAIQYN
ncbi:MAG TPA: hypothetical protein VF622_10910 [Segetibacter sp.]|jgi:hypothetical protein